MTSTCSSSAETAARQRARSSGRSRVQMTTLSPRSRIEHPAKELGMLRSRGAPRKLASPARGGGRELAANSPIGKLFDACADGAFGPLAVADRVLCYLRDRSRRGGEDGTAGTKGVEERTVRLADRTRAQHEDTVACDEAGAIRGIVGKVQDARSHSLRLARHSLVGDLAREQEAHALCGEHRTSGLEHFGHQL